MAGLGGMVRAVTEVEVLRAFAENIRDNHGGIASEQAEAALGAADLAANDTVRCACGEADVPQCKETKGGDRCLWSRGGHDYHKGARSGWSTLP